MSYDAFKNDWLYTENILDAGFIYGPQRDTTGKPTAPTDLVKVRKGNPTQNQIAVAAATFGYRATDQIITVWAETLRADPEDASTDAIVPVEHDRLTVDGVTWIIKSVKKTIYDTQFLCHCQQSTETEE